MKSDPKLPCQGEKTASRQVDLKSRRRKLGGGGRGPGEHTWVKSTIQCRQHWRSGEKRDFSLSVKTGGKKKGDRAKVKGRSSFERK